MGQANFTVAKVTPRASVSVVDAKANVAYVLPVAAISYIELIYAAEIDTAGRHKYIVEEALVVADERLVDFAKNISSTANSTDFLSAIAMLKGLVESVELSETFESLLVTMVDLFSESVITDIELIDFAKNLLESVTVPDVVATGYEKPFTEEDLVTTDVHASSMGMPHDEVVSMDGFAGVLGGPGAVFHSILFNDDVGRERVAADVHKALSDESFMSDVYDRVLQWEKDYEDFPVVTELLASDLLKPLGDDEFSLVDVCEAQLVIEREFAHLVGTADEQAFGASTLYEDTVSCADEFSFEKSAGAALLFNVNIFNASPFNSSI